MDDSSPKDERTISVSSDWTASNVRDYFYFKTGAYQNTASSGSRPKVEIYDSSLDITYDY